MFDSPPDQIAVPNVVGLSEQKARAAIGDAGLAVGSVEYQPDDTVANDRVISQDPNRDQYVDPGAAVSIVVSTGKPEVTVPSVVGQNRADAAAALREAGLKVAQEERESDATRGQVVESSPPAGTQVQEGSSVTIYYSDGPEKVPDVVGMKQADAEQAIRDAGFVPDVVESANTTEPKGTVIQQSPTAGQTPPEGSTVTIVVSTYEEPSETPSPSESPSESPTLLPSESPSAAGRPLP
jgi:serine/threonine-protein kinase